MSLPTSLLPLSTFLLLLILLSPTTLHSHSPNYLKLQLIHTNTLLPNSSYLSFFHHHHHHHRHRNRPRLHSQIISGASNGSGQYFASLTLGTPPQHLLLVADTGSDLIWLRSSSSFHHRRRHNRSAFLLRRSHSFHPLHCLHTKCHLLPHQHCKGPHSSCLYTYSYADGSSTSGILSTDVTSFNTTLTFGCAFNLTGPSITGPAFEGAAGVMGLGKGPLSFPDQLGKRFGNRFSYCLLDYTISPPKSSYLVIGGRHNDVVSRNNTQSTPLITNIFATTFYYIEILYVIIENVKLPINPSVWSIDDLGNGGTIIDSGTTLTFFPEPAYREIVKEMSERVELPRLKKPSQVFDLCYNISGVSKLNLPSLKLVFAGDSVYDPPPGNYFIDTAKDVKCLALQPVTSPAGNAVIGNLMQQGFLFEFDNDKSRLLFSRSGCGNPR